MTDNDVKTTEKDLKTTEINEEIPKTALQKLCNLKVLCIITGVAEITLMCHGFGIFGNLEFVMREQGYFTGKSEAELETTYSRLYTEVTIMMAIYKFIAGTLIDLKGIWFSRYFTHILAICGLIILSLMSAESDYLAWIGYPLFYGVGVGFFYSYLPLTNLYPKRKSILMSISMAANSLAYIWYVPFDKLEHTNWFYIGILVLQPLLILRTFLLLPRFSTSEGKNTVMGWKSRTVKPRQQQTEETDANESGIEPPTFKTKMSSIKKSVSDTLFQCFKPAVAVMFFGWFLPGDIRAQSFNVEMQPWLRWATEPDYNETQADERLDRVAMFQNVWNYCVIFGIIVSILFGFIVDWTTTFMVKKYEISHKLAQVRTVIIAQFCVTTCGLLSNLLATQQTTGTITYILFLLASVTRGTIYITRNLFILSTVPLDFQGRVLGLTSIVQIVTSLVQPPLTKFTVNNLDGNYGRINLYMAIFLAFTYVSSSLLTYYYFVMVKDIDEGGNGVLVGNKQKLDEKVDENGKSGEVPKILLSKEAESRRNRAFTDVSNY